MRFRLKYLLPALLTLSAAVTEAGAVHLWNLGRIYRPWQQLEMQLKQRGEPVTEAAFGFLDVPDEENFLLGHLFGTSIQSVRPYVMRKAADFPFPGTFPKPAILWNSGAVQSALVPEPADLRQLETFLPLAEIDLSQRTQCQVPRTMPRLNADIGMMSSIFGEMKSLSGAATWLIRQGRAADALTCIRTGLRIGRGFGEGSSLVSSLVGSAIAPLPQAAIWEGLCRGVWNDQQLQLLDAEIASLHLYQSSIKSLRWERYHGTQVIENMATRSPHFSHENEAQFCAFLCGHSRILREMNQELFARTFTRMIDAVEGRIEGEPNLISQEPFRKILHPGNFLAVLMLPALSSLWTDSREGDARNALARWAIAVERYRLRHGRRPEELKQLPPELTPSIPSVHGVPDRPQYEADTAGTGSLWFPAGTLAAQKDFSWHLQIAPEPAVWPR